MNKLMEEIWKLDAEEQLLIAKAILERADSSGMPHSIEFEEEQIWYQNLLARQEKTPENVVPWEEMRHSIEMTLVTAQNQILEQRLAESKKNPASGYSWPEAKAMIQRRN